MLGLSLIHLPPYLLVFDSNGPSKITYRSALRQFSKEFTNESYWIIDLSTIWSGMSEVGRYADIGYSIRATDKVLSDRKRFFPTQIVETSLTRLYNKIIT